MSEWKAVPMSSLASQVRNPIRELVDIRKPKPNPALSVIPLSIGLCILSRISHTTSIRRFDCQKHFALRRSDDLRQHEATS
jgi:hypothetical protein